MKLSKVISKVNQQHDKCVSDAEALATLKDLFQQLDSTISKLREAFVTVTVTVESLPIDEMLAELEEQEKADKQRHLTPEMVDRLPIGSRVSFPTPSGTVYAERLFEDAWDMVDGGIGNGACTHDELRGQAGVRLTDEHPALTEKQMLDTLAAGIAATLVDEGGDIYKADYSRSKPQFRYGDLRAEYHRPYRLESFGARPYNPLLPASEQKSWWVK